MHFLKLILSLNVSTILVHENTCREREREGEGRGAFFFQALSRSFSTFHTAGEGGREGEGEGGPGEEASWLSKEASCLTPAERWTINWPWKLGHRQVCLYTPYLGR